MKVACHANGLWTFERFAGRPAPRAETTLTTENCMTDRPLNGKHVAIMVANGFEETESPNRKGVCCKPAPR